jgi:hypothetical protein
LSVSGLISSVDEYALADEADAGRPGTDLPTGTEVTSVISPASAGSVRESSVNRSVTSVAAVTSSAHAAAMTTSRRRLVPIMPRRAGSPGMLNCRGTCSTTSASSCSDMALLCRASGAIVLSVETPALRKTT